MQDSDYKHNFHTHTFRCKHAKGDVATKTGTEHALTHG